MDLVHSMEHAMGMKIILLEKRFRLPVFRMDRLYPMFINMRFSNKTSNQAFNFTIGRFLYIYMSFVKWNTKLFQYYFLCKQSLSATNFWVDEVYFYCQSPMSDVEQVVATVLSTLGSLWIIGTNTACLVIFLLAR